MTKVKNPVLSLGAKGSLGDAISFRESRSVSIAEKKPKLPYFLTLPVQYQRWLYEDYAYLWTQQTQAVKDVYRAAGVRFHLTAFQYWMKYQLTNLPDIAAMWHLDYESGALVTDFSKNANHGTVFGATPAAGVIDGAYYFDGVNDRIRFNHSPTLNVTSDFTIEFFLYLHDYSSGGIIDKAYWTNGYMVWVDPTPVLSIFVNNAQTAVIAPPPLFTPTHVTAIIKTSGCLIYLNAVPGALGAGAIPLGNNSFVYIGQDVANRFPHFKADHFRITTRVLDTQEISRHSLRRYP